MRKIFTLFMTMVLCAGLVVPVSAKEEAKDKDTVILYTNDVHTYIDGVLSYDVIAALKDELETQYEHVLLVDAGDHVQGTAYGSMDKGASIVKLMNAAGYDLATPGNHEIDYGMDGFFDVVSWAEFPYVSCNFHHEKDGVCGETVLDGWKMFTCGEEKIAFIGITTPETFTKSTPFYFQDANGNYIYDIAGGNDGEELYTAVQTAIDEAEAAGATTVIALGHLGDDASSKPWTSEDVIANTCGLDAFIDGHSHSTVEGRVATDEDGHSVLLTQTGEYFDRIGMMVIDDETGAVKTDLIECEEILAKDGETVEGYELSSELYLGKEVLSDAEVKAIKDAWISEISEQLEKKIGSVSVNFANYDEGGNRLVRSQETNNGDFTADALYYLFDNMDMDVDIAFMNGGGIRNKTTITGDISYQTCKEIHTFGNVACLQSVTGQQILDALEWGAKEAGNGENGGFLQVSGLTYCINTAVASTVRADDKGVWTGGPTGAYRVHDVKVYNKETGAWDELDLDATYNLAGYNYTLRNLGDGFAMFEGAVNVLDYVMEDYLVLANYVQAFENDTVGAGNSPLAVKYPGFTVDYSTVKGSGRITMCEAEKAAEAVYTVQKGDTLWGLSRKYGCTVEDIVSCNSGLIKNPRLILVGWELTIP
ncbi:MAG: 5'-nucleotidase C-terminal domain-containing protein [Lachnospiraceae bacterium]|nr:5'-nucleotidase C-terminal domain-containing protein [Lachnospiraceae bacterium]